MIKLKPPLSTGNMKDDKMSVNQKNRTQTPMGGLPTA